MANKPGLLIFRCEDGRRMYVHATSSIEDAQKQSVWVEIECDAVRPDGELSTKTAREVAAALLKTADEVDAFNEGGRGLP